MFRTPSRWIMAWIDGLDRLAAMHPGVIAVGMPSREEDSQRESVRSAALVSPDTGEVARPRVDATFGVDAPSTSFRPKIGRKSA